MKTTVEEGKLNFIAPKAQSEKGKENTIQKPLPESTEQEKKSPIEEK